MFRSSLAQGVTVFLYNRTHPFCLNKALSTRGYYLDTTGKNTQKITEYIRNQRKEDAEQSQLTMDFDPITGSK